MNMIEIEAATLDQKIAEELRALLARRRMSARQLAADLGWGHMYLQRRMLGRVPFSMSDLYQLTKALKVPLQSLLPADMDFRCSLAFVA